MRSVRIVDRGSAAQGPEGSGSGRPDDDSARPTVADKRAYYWSGPGWVLAYEEARRLMRTGSSLRDAASSVGWSEADLRSAIGRKGKPPEPSTVFSAVVPHERPRRTVKQRVAGLKNVSQQTLRLARRYYEVECMTVREVARALEEPYEKTYLVLIKAGTKFRRPGRRGQESKEPVRPDPVVRDEAPKPRRSAPVRAPKPRATSKPKRKARIISTREVELAMRRVLGKNWRGI